MITDLDKYYAENYKDYWGDSYKIFNRCDLNCKRKLLNDAGYEVSDLNVKAYKTGTPNVYDKKEYGNESVVLSIDGIVEFNSLRQLVMS